MAEKLKNKGTLFEVQPHLIKHKLRYSDLPLKGKQLDFLMAVMNTAEIMGEDVFTAADLTPQLEADGLATTRPTIDRYCRKLKEADVFDSSIRQGSGVRAIKRRLWKLRDIDDVEESMQRNVHAQTLKRSDPVAATKKLEAANIQYLKTLENAKPRSENFYFGFLDRCMARSPWEKIDGNCLRTKLGFKKEVVEITTSTQTNGSRLVCWNDKPVMKAILSHIIALIEERLASGVPPQELDNAFFIDLVEIAKLMQMGHPNSTKNHARIWNSLQALESTRFDLAINDPENSEFMKFFHLGYSNNLRESHFSFIGHIDIVDDNSSRSVPRKLILSLGAHLWYRIKHNPQTKAIFRSHKEMLQTDLRGIMHVIYDYLRSVIFRVPNGKEREIHRPLQHFAETLVPSLSYFEFKRQFFRDLNKVANGQMDGWDMEAGEEFEVLFCGYYITLHKLEEPPKDLQTRDNLMILVRRDPYDILIGDPDKKPSPAEASLGKLIQTSFF